MFTLKFQEGGSSLCHNSTQEYGDQKKSEMLRTIPDHMFRSTHLKLLLHNQTSLNPNKQMYENLRSVQS